MTIITEDYVSFETAKLLKEKGFDEPTIAYAYGEGMIAYFSRPKTIDNMSVEAGKYPLPTLQMAMKWLREVHKIFILVQPDYPESCNYKLYWAWSVNMLKEDCIQLKFYGCNCDSYEAACEAACLYCLRNLI